MKRSKLNPEFINFARNHMDDPDKTVTITRAEFADVYTTVIYDNMNLGSEDGKGDNGFLVAMIGRLIAGDIERCLFDDDEPNAADKTDVSDGKE